MRRSFSFAAVVFLIPCLLVISIGRSMVSAQEAYSSNDPELGSMNDYLNTSENSPPPTPRRRVIVVKDPRTILKVEMGDDVAVTPVPGRAPAPGPAEFVGSPRTRTYVFSNESESMTAMR